MCDMTLDGNHATSQSDDNRQQATMPIGDDPHTTNHATLPTLKKRERGVVLSSVTKTYLPGHYILPTLGTYSLIATAVAILNPTSVCMYSTYIHTESFILSIRSNLEPDSHHHARVTVRPGRTCTVHTTPDLWHYRNND